MLNKSKLFWQPERDWLILIGLWFLGVVLIFVVGILILTGLNRWSQSSTLTATSTLTLDEVKIKQALKIIDTATERAAALQAAPPPVIDPSL